MSTHTSESAAAAVLKLSPPLTVGGATVLGLELSDVVLLLTGAYAALQIGFLLYDRIVKPRKEKRHGRK